MTGHVKTSTEVTRSRALSVLIVRRDPYSPWTLARLLTGQKTDLLLRMSFDIYDIILITTNIFVMIFKELSARDGCWSLVFVLH